MSQDQTLCERLQKASKIWLISSMVGFDWLKFNGNIVKVG